MSDPIEFFPGVSDDILTEIASYDWESIEILCYVLTLDLQLLKENNNKPISKQNLVS